MHLATRSQDCLCARRRPAWDPPHLLRWRGRRASCAVIPMKNKREAVYTTCLLIISLTCLPITALLRPRVLRANVPGITSAPLITQRHVQLPTAHNNALLFQVQFNVWRSAEPTAGALSRSSRGLPGRLDTRGSACSGSMTNRDMFPGIFRAVQAVHCPASSFRSGHCSARRLAPTTSPLLLRCLVLLSLTCIPVCLDTRTSHRDSSLKTELI